MKIRIVLAFLFACVIQARADMTSSLMDTVRWDGLEKKDLSIYPVQPVCQKGVLVSSPWKGNWFVGIGGGASAFIGTPLGCADMFDRVKPVLELAFGKWFTPAIGGRVVYRGLEFKDYGLDTHKYHSIQADFLWNVNAGVYNARDRPRWKIVPYIGLGLLHNEDYGNSPFAFSYGVMGQYALSRRTYLTMELGGKTTFSDFDGHGDSREFGDHLLGITAGLTFQIGKSGWKRVVDATPYATQNDWLLRRNHKLADENRDYAARHDKDMRTIAELKKILEIEGLLDSYGHFFEKEDSADTKVYPRNDYSGLNSLRARMRKRQKRQPESFVGDTLLADKNITAIGNDSLKNEEAVGAPIYFFFDLGTTRLTESSQSLNLDELARVAKKFGLAVSVSGAADSATGNPILNGILSEARADYIVAELVSRGVPTENVCKTAKGGIAEHQPNEANRHTKVMLFYK